MDTKNGIFLRLQEFAESKGGFSEVARSIGKQPAMFYNLKSRNAKPSVDTLAEIAEAYPDFDINYLVRGSNEQTDSKSVDKRIHDLEEENKRLKSTVERYEFIIDTFMKSGK